MQAEYTSEAKCLQPVKIFYRAKSRQKIGAVIMKFLEKVKDSAVDQYLERYSIEK